MRRQSPFQYQESIPREHNGNTLQEGGSASQAGERAIWSEAPDYRAGETSREDQKDVSTPIVTGSPVSVDDNEEEWVDEEDEHDSSVLPEVLGAIDVRKLKDFALTLYKKQSFNTSESVTCKNGLTRRNCQQCRLRYRIL